MALGVITYSIAAHTDRRKGWVRALTASSIVYLTGLIVAAEDWWPARPSASWRGSSWRRRSATPRAPTAPMSPRSRSAPTGRSGPAGQGAARVMDERLRIARELHDVVAHHIAVISVQAGAAAHILQRRPEQVGPVLNHIREASDTVLKEIQSVVGVLRGTDEPKHRTHPRPGPAAGAPRPGDDRVPGAAPAGRRGAGAARWWISPHTSSRKP